MSSMMVYKRIGSEKRILVTKKDDTTWKYRDPDSGNEVITTRHNLIKEYKYMAKESKLKGFDTLSIRKSAQKKPQ